MWRPSCRLNTGRETINLLCTCAPGFCCQLFVEVYCYMMQSLSLLQIYTDARQSNYADTFFSNTNSRDTIFTVNFFGQALRFCISANQYTLCSLLIKGQTPKRHAVQPGVPKPGGDGGDMSPSII